VLISSCDDVLLCWCVDLLMCWFDGVLMCTRLKGLRQRSAVTWLLQ
jgi:hypothetical protein